MLSGCGSVKDFLLGHGWPWALIRIIACSMAALIARVRSLFSPRLRTFARSRSCSWSKLVGFPSEQTYSSSLASASAAEFAVLLDWSGLLGTVVVATAAAPAAKAAAGDIGVVLANVWSRSGTCSAHSGGLVATLAQVHLLLRAGILGARLKTSLSQ